MHVTFSCKLMKLQQMGPANALGVAQIPKGYVVLLEDTELMNGEAFFKPGVDKASWNDTTPSTRILVRHDHYEQVCFQQRNPFSLLSNA